MSNQAPDNFNWSQKIFEALNVSLAIYIVIMLVSFVKNIKNMLIYGPIIAASIFVLLMILFYFRRTKNIFVASILNIIPIYPVGFAYANEEIIPSGVWGFVIIMYHFIFFSIDPIITFLLASFNMYPVKEGYTLSYF